MSPLAAGGREKSRRGYHRCSRQLAARTKDTLACIRGGKGGTVHDQGRVVLHTSLRKVRHSAWHHRWVRSFSAARSAVLPVFGVGVVWSASYVAYKYMQLAYHRHCTDNLLRAVLFSRSDACVHLASGIQVVEQVSGKILYAVGAAVGYHICRAAARLTHLVHEQECVVVVDPGQDAERTAYDRPLVPAEASPTI